MTVEETERPASSPVPAPDEAAVRDAGRAAARLSKALELAVSDRNLSLPQYRLLAFLSGGPERATELAEWLEVSAPSLTALVDGLVHKGLVERVTSTEDRRCVRHVLTPAGAASLEGGDDAIAERLATIMEFLSDDEARRGLEGLGLIGLAMQRRRDAERAEEAAAAKELKDSQKSNKDKKARAKDGAKEVAATR